jgi:hypothetical protein
MVRAMIAWISALKVISSESLRADIDECHVVLAIALLAAISVTGFALFAIEMVELICFLGMPPYWNAP